MSTFNLISGAKSVIDQDKARNYFIHHLNRINCTKAHLTERLSEIDMNDNFKDIRPVIKEAQRDLILQSAVIGQLFLLFSAKETLSDCGEMIGFIEDAFNGIYLRSDEPVLRDFAILYYLKSLDSIGDTSLQLLRQSADQIEGARFTHLPDLLNAGILAENKLLSLMSDRCGLGTEQSKKTIVNEY